jgi:ribosomal protein L23
VIDQKANKEQIGGAIEIAFHVKVTRVNITSCCGRPKRVRSKSSRRDTLVGTKKKAIIILKGKDEINVV